MLAYFLAILMAMISLTLYLNAFISPKIHRQDDFLWSGLGLFYALTLWICAGRITGAVLLGQIALVSLTIAFIWENRQIRKAITTNGEENSLLEGFSLLNFILTSLTKIPQLTKKKTVTPSTVEEKSSTPPPEVSSTEIEANPTVTSEASPSSSESVSSEVLEKETTVVIPITPTLEKEKEIITEDNLIKEVTQEETKTPESLIKEVIEEEIIDEIPSPSSDDASIISEDDDFDVDALPLSSPSPSESSKGNIFSKIFGFFRKSPSPSETPSPDVIVEEKTTDIDLTTTATEVETAIDNLDLVDADNNQTETNEETLLSSEKLESESNDNETPEDNSVSETIETPITDNIIETSITDSDNNDNVDSIEVDDISDNENETEELTEEISEIIVENIDSSSNNNEDNKIDEILDAISDNLEEIELVAETENIEIDTETQEKELEVDEEVPLEDTIHTLEDLSFADDTNTISTIEDELNEILEDNKKNE